MRDREIKLVKNTSATRDLTTGSPLKLIIGFALPMFLGLLFQQFYSMVDTIIVGKYLGVDPFAGVGSTGSLNFMVIGFCTGLCSGFAVPVAQMFGAKNYSGLRKMVANSIWLCVAFSIVITTAVVILCKPILRMMNTPENIFNYAYIYIVIIFAGIPFTILYNVAAAITRALGDSKSPVFFLAISSVINIVLDYIFIVWVGMNIEGAAIATLISQAVSGIICVLYMRKKFDVLKIEKGDMRLELSYMGKLVSIGVPMGLQYSITAIGTVVVQTAVNGLGSLYVAGVTAGSKINMFISCPIDALGQTMAPYAGQNIGAGRIDRVGQGLKVACLCGFVISAVLFGAMALFGKHLSLLFMDEKNTAIMQYSFQFLMSSVSCYCLLTLVNAVRFTIQGMGFSTFAMLAGILEMVARVIAGLWLAPMIGFWGICLASPLAWLFADAFLIPAFFICKKKIGKNAETAKAA